MCQLCAAKSLWGRRGFLLAAGASAATPVLAQVNVGEQSSVAKLVPAGQIEQAATQQYAQLLEQARAKRALAPDSHPQLQRLRTIANRLIPDAPRWNERSRQWRWEINLIGSKTINAFCMPGGKIAFFTGILDQLQLTDDEAAMVMGHEMAHALREHARARMAKNVGTSLAISIGGALLGLGSGTQELANMGGQLLTLKFSRDDEREADLVGLEMAARGAYEPEAAVRLWQKMDRASGGAGAPGFMSTHPTGPDRIQRLQENVPRVRGLYQQAVAAKR